MNNPHLIVDLSGHGFGHAGMTVPILNEIKVQNPNLRLTIRTTVPVDWLTERIDGPFDFIQQSDFGMAMANPRRVLAEKSLTTYHHLHADWAQKVEVATDELAALKPTLLLSNVTYISLAAAKRLEIPAIAFCSLNWADVFRHYCINLPGAKGIWEQMADSYAAADIFLQPAPSMRMPSIRNGRSIGPVAKIGRDRKRELRERLDLAEGIPIVLLVLRGMPSGFSITNWPRLKGMRVLVGPGQKVSHPDVFPTDGLDMPFVDLIRSCDVLITKPGYGLVTEAACNGTPVILLPWEDWPETLGLEGWLRKNGRTLRLSDQRVHRGDFLAEVRTILSMSAPPIPLPSGITEAVELIRF